jgi:hypothetical protein
MDKEKEKINPFFQHRVEGPKKEVALGEVLISVLGYRPTLFSKRLAPPLCICNSRLYFKKHPEEKPEMVWDGDLDIYNQKSAIARVAKLFDGTLELFKESGQKPVWSSDTEDLWLGYCGDEASPQPISKVYPLYKQWSDETRQQWAIDHGLAKKPRKVAKKTRAKLKATKRPKKKIK